MLASGLHLSCRARALSPLRRPVIQPGLLTWPDVHNDEHPRRSQFDAWLHLILDGSASVNPLHAIDVLSPHRPARRAVCRGSRAGAS